MDGSTERRGSNALAWAWVVVLAAALGVRAFALERPLRYDEVYTARLFVLEQGDPEHLNKLPYHSNNHLLNTWMARRSVDLLGVSDLTLRLPSMLFGLLHLLVVFGLVRFLFGVGPAILATGIIALSPLSILYDTECRGYASMMLFSALCVRTWLQCGVGPSWRSWTAFTVSSVLLLLAHPFGIVPLGALVVFGLVWAVPGGRRVRPGPLGLSLLVIAAATIPIYSAHVPFREYLEHMWAHGRLPETSFLRYAATNEPVTGAFLLKLAALFAGGAGWARLLVLGALAGAGVAVGALAGRGAGEPPSGELAWGENGRRRRYGVAICLVVLVLPVAACFVVGLPVLPRLFAFGSSFLAALCALGSWGFGRWVTRRRPGRVGLTAAVSVVGLAALAVAGHWPSRGDWPDEGRLVDMRAVARWLDARRQPLDFVVTNTAGDQAGGINLRMKWYLDAELPTAEPERLFSDASRIWTVSTRGSMPPVSPDRGGGESAAFDHIRVQAYDRRFRVVRQAAFPGAEPRPLLVRQYDSTGALVSPGTLAQPAPGPIWSFRPAAAATRAILYLPAVPAGSQQPVAYAFTVDGADSARVALACERPGSDGVWPFDVRTVESPRPGPGRAPRVYLAVTEPDTALIRLMIDLSGLDPNRQIRVGPVRLYVGARPSPP